MLPKHITQSFIKPTQIYGNNLFNNFININKIFLINIGLLKFVIYKIKPDFFFLNEFL